jgi:quercetin dioxygenase-like cupin family protein
MRLDQTVLPGPPVAHGAAHRLRLVLTQPAGCTRSLGGAWYRVLPGGVITRHRHTTKAELWFVVQGTGLVWLNDEEVMVEPGSAIYTPPGTSHRLENTGSQELLLVVATHPPVEALDPSTGGRPGTEELETTA